MHARLHGETKMHNEFKKLLKNATGRSEHVIVINLDIRGFTSFCQQVESLQVAAYITRVYSAILEKFFANASYYKPTGDGLIVIIPYDKEALKDVAKKTMESCLNLLEDFSTLCADDHMINFLTPKEIGIGISRGSACCITSKDDSVEKTLDYSGRLLNLASRLMDAARPSGIIFDDSFHIDLLPKEMTELFSEDEIYIRGVAEEPPPIKVYYTKKYTLIPESYKQPLKEPKWKTKTYEYPFAKLKTTPRRLRLPLEISPLDKSKIIVSFSYDDPKVKGFRDVLDYFMHEDELEYYHRGETHAVRADMKSIAETLEKAGVTDDMNVRIDVIYPVKRP